MVLSREVKPNDLLQNLFRSGEVARPLQDAALS
jgi:hypothetical protein